MARELHALIMLNLALTRLHCGHPSITHLKQGHDAAALPLHVAAALRTAGLLWSLR